MRCFQVRPKCTVYIGHCENRLLWPHGILRAWFCRLSWVVNYLRSDPGSFVAAADSSRRMQAPGTRAFVEHGI